MIPQSGDHLLRNESNQQATTDVEKSVVQLEKMLQLECGAVPHNFPETKNDGQVSN